MSNTLRIILAPMEGVLNAPMRELLTGLGDSPQPGYDVCVTEFVRIVDQLLPSRVFYRLAPELHNNGRTLAGTPVRVQLLGQDPQCLAENAARAAELGAPGIDLNFGCPARTVNKNRGGAVLLKEPARIGRIVAAVRAAVSDDIPVSAKIRLGWDDTAQLEDIGRAIEDAGATELTVHARTKTQGYKPPAYWEHIDTLRQGLSIPVIANGEIWTVEQGLRCAKISGCDSLMLGRGAMATPNLGAAIKGLEPNYDWGQILGILLQYCQFMQQRDDFKYLPNLIKQWFGYLKVRHPQAEEMFVQLRSIRQAQDMLQFIAAAASKQRP